VYQKMMSGIDDVKAVRARCNCGKPHANRPAGIADGCGSGAGSYERIAAAEVSR
jgi:hypothetical protein